MKKFRIMMSALFAALMAMPAEAQQTIAYSYDSGSTLSGYWGSGKKENYDVAIHIADANLVGTQITGVKIPFANGEETSNHKIWLSNELKLETIDGKKQNVADIATVEAIVENGELSATFAEPYTITEAGVFVGYSFDMDNLTENNASPIMVAQGKQPGSFYLRSSRTFRSWEDMYEYFDYASSMVVYINGDFAENSVAISSVSEANVKVGDPGEVSVTLVNNGSGMVSSIEYSYEIAELKGENTFTLPEPIPAQYNSKKTVKLPLPAVAEKGAYVLNLAITKVNGAENTNTLAKACTTLNAWSVIPVHRPLFEEYTGFWCGWCPRGFVGLELMNEYYPDSFVGLSIHNGDILEVLSESSFPSDVLGFPTSYIDRVHETDPYYGDTSNPFGIAETYLARAEQLAPANIEVVADWADDKQEVINVTTFTTFIKDIADGDYRIAYMLIADDLHGEGGDWAQSNYYSGDTYYENSVGLDQFVNGGSYVEGLHFNDVLVLAPDILGVQGSIPAAIQADETISHEYSFTVANAVNTEGRSIIQDKSKLRVIAAIVDATTGEVVNSNKTSLDSTTGISSVKKPAGDIKSVSFYDVSGRKVNIPTNGLYIKSVVYKNGAVETSKVVMK